MKSFQQSGAVRAKVHDKILDRYGLDAAALRIADDPSILTDFNIYLEVEPLP